MPLPSIAVIDTMAKVTEVRKAFFKPTLSGHDRSWVKSGRNPAWGRNWGRNPGGTLLTACPLTHSASCCVQPSSFSLEMAPPRRGWVLSGQSSPHRWSCDPGNPSAEVPSFQVILGWVKLTVETTLDSGHQRTSTRFCRSLFMESDQKFVIFFPFASLLVLWCCPEPIYAFPGSLGFINPSLKCLLHFITQLFDCHVADSQSWTSQLSWHGVGFSLLSSPRKLLEFLICQPLCFPFSFSYFFCCLDYNMITPISSFPFLPPSPPYIPPHSLSNEWPPISLIIVVCVYIYTVS